VPLREGIVLKAIGCALVRHAGWLVAPSRAPAAVNSPGGPCRGGRRWLLVVSEALPPVAAYGDGKKKLEARRFEDAGFLESLLKSFSPPEAG